jgi:hypothetical protein
MRFRYYVRVVNSTDFSTQEFTEANFKEAGLVYSEFGMTYLESLELINKWNQAGGGRYTFWLAEAKGQS